LREGSNRKKLIEDKMTKSIMLLYGKNSILQRLKKDPKSIRKIFLNDIFDDGYILTIASRRKIPIIRLRRNEFLRLKRADNLQGIVAEVEKFTYTPLRELLDTDTRPSLIFLDGISDPQNLGSIIRTAACFGDFAIVVPKHSACDVNDTVLHVACGGENFVPISMVTNISTALRDAKSVGYWVVGAMAKAGEDLNKTKLPFPLCLVLGSEGSGIRQGLQGQLDLKVSLHMSGAPLSFNVGVTCAIFCSEIVRQRK